MLLKVIIDSMWDKVDFEISEEQTGFQPQQEYD